MLYVYIYLDLNESIKERIKDTAKYSIVIECSEKVEYSKKDEIFDFSPNHGFFDAANLLEILADEIDSRMRKMSVENIKVTLRLEKDGLVDFAEYKKK